MVQVSSAVKIRLIFPGGMLADGSNDSNLLFNFACLQHS